ncbi:EF hand domain protein [Aspergillus ibericus CBS 121593]|uniref:EF hand domain protein n=1 Tax=Aspergillus ibericus CBS 121593 TaxID=1448316 RepID=A0A395GT41_9EURO|nr:EF hand domain protein [Aspergillus ibericus CBS 121593]RAK97857.1 EF hand domain protein [Aspergillus ibericus CBS 121593]
MPDTHPRPALSRNRPILYLLSGVVAAYAIVYIHNQFFSSSSSTSQTPLRRRRAVRRQRRRGESESANAAAADTPSSRAIAHLEQLERQNGVYGTFRIETEDGRRVESGLLPSLLATRDQLMEEVGVPQDHAERMREMMEDTFLESFLALDFPPAHTLEEGTPERDYLIEQLQRRGISRAGIERALVRFNEDNNYGEELRRRRQNGERVTLSTSTFPEESSPAQNMDGGETVVDDQSVFSWREGQNESPPTREGQNLLNLLYHIAEDQARRDGYIHRGVTCNSCGAIPIQGIRYRCANCIDYDLCETCEAMGVHIKTHLFYKVRIPAPFLGNPRQSQPVWYPGKPAMLPRNLSRSLAKRLMKETGFDNTELDALWDQFRCLANHEWEDDPNKLYMAIDRKTFDRCFVPNTSIRPPAPSLIYDRMFAFYDTNSDGLIGFEEFLKGIASLNNKSNDERLRRVFRGYDIDGDGYIERKDFLRVFRAYYALSRELTRDMVAGMEDDFLEGGARDVVLGSQPISSAFPGSIPSGEASRTGEGKRVNQDGDLEIVDNEGIVRPDRTDTADRHSVVGDAAVRSQYDRIRPMFPTAARLETPSGSGVAHASGSNTRRDVNGEDASNPPEDASVSSGGSDRWPPPEGQVRDHDIVDALGSFVPINDITDPADRDRVGAAVYNRMCEQDQLRVHMARSTGIHERWQRRRFYTDEEDGATVPQGYHSDMDVGGLTEDEDEDEVDEPQPESHPPSPRSRSSSKVRFQDDLTDDYDVRSNPSTSSRSILVGERWGGFEIPEVERDVGKEILYQVTQQGFNELLDLLFKPKEDLLMEAFRSRAERKMWAHEIQRLESGTQVPQEDRPSPDEADELPETSMVNPLRDRPLDELLSRAGYSVRSPPLEPVQDGPVLPPPSPDLGLPNDDVVYLGVPEEIEAEAEAAILAPSSGHDHDLLRRMMSPILPTSPSSHASTFEDDDVSLPHSISSYYDPTLPHHRPNEDECDESREDPEPILSSPPSSTHLAFDDDEGPPQSPQLPAELRLDPSGTTSFPVPTSPSISSPEAEATAPKLSPSPIPPLPSSPTLPRRASPPRPPSKAKLAHLAYLEKIEREAKERGGSGAKLNFTEFAQRMALDRGRTLAFVASWIEMASF